MPYSATSHRLLISAPGDVPAEDVQTVMRTIARWNVIYGQQFGAVVVPMHWELHAAAEHGVRPQASLNVQLVETVDIVIALFWHRLGSSTGEAESGTVEEIDKAHANGAYVAILQCIRDVDPRRVDPAQAERLGDFLDRIRSESLMLTYAEDGELAQHVDAILNRAVTRSSTRGETATETPGSRADVWPRVESSEGERIGDLQLPRRWQLVLANTGTEGARHVRFRLEEETPGDMLPQVYEDVTELEALAPGGEARYALARRRETARQVRCVVVWEDSAGEHENTATLRFF